ncbi:GH92 family glycosyl hydrolase [Parapedobacter sp.]
MSQLFMVGKKVYYGVGWALLSLLGACASGIQQEDFAAADFVNPFIGASTSVGEAGVYHGLGKTFPGATTPYGMVQVSPNTITGGDNSPGYSYEHKTIEGFAFTQMSGVGWYGDLGNFLVMPTTGSLKTIAGKEDGSIQGYRSRYDKNSELAQPGYYAVQLADYGIGVETTAAPHSGMIRFTFPENKESRIQIDLARRVGGTSVRQYIRKVDDRTIQGWMECTPEGGGWGDGEGKADYTVYFYARFSKPLADYGFWRADIPDGWSRKRDDVVSERYLRHVEKAEIIQGETELEGDHLGFFTDFETDANEEVTLQVGISFVDLAGAKNNFRKEIEGKDFDQVRAEATDLWNKALSRVNVQGGTDDKKTIFYTALYHTMIDPRTYTDVDGRYTGGDQKIHEDSSYTRRTIFSGWDVFRSQFPLQTLINPQLVSDQLNSLIELADESGKGYFERWELLNAYSGCMIGNPALSVLADAYVKGIRDYDVEKAYQYAVHTSQLFGNDELGYTGPPFSISNTLEYAYTDWCISQLASGLGKQDDAQRFLEKGQAYRHVFDTENGWFRPKKEDGSWEDWPENARTTEWYGTIESNPYQQGWFVPHDIPGMIELMGGRSKALADLTDFFEKTPEHMLWNDYYNHANEPVHLVPFLFNHMDAPWLTQKWTRHICETAYENSVEGIVGNEDVGQMSAWYVLAASGIHPSCPGTTRYEITSPLFDEVAFALDPDYFDGTTFKITAHDNSPENSYIQKALLNGQPYNKCYIDFQDMVAGGTLELFMGPQPNENWGKATGS